MFVLKLIWRLFSQPSSLWVVSVKCYLLKQETFWDVKENVAGSWVWRKLLQHRSLAQQFVCMDVNDGRTVRFWSDLWQPRGRLIDITGEIGTQKLGIRRDATISDVLVNGDWRFRRCRDPQIQSLILDINGFRLSLGNDTADGVLWKTGEDTYSDRFVSTATWDLVRAQKDIVNRRSLIWFSQGIPRFAFISCDQKQISNRASHNTLGPPSRLSLLWGARRDQRPSFFRLPLYLYSLAAGCWESVW